VPPRTGSHQDRVGLVTKKSRPARSIDQKPPTREVNYGTLVDAKSSTSYKRTEQPSPSNGVIKCWNEGVQRMKVGGKIAAVSPRDIASEIRAARNPGGAALTFQIELLEIVGASNLQEK